MDIVDPKLPQQPIPILIGVDQRRGRLHKQRLGMPGEGDGGALRPPDLRQPDAFRQQRLMPQMHPIKEAQGKDLILHDAHRTA